MDHEQIATVACRGQPANDKRNVSLPRLRSEVARDCRRSGGVDHDRRLGKQLIEKSVCVVGVAETETMSMSGGEWVESEAIGSDCFCLRFAGEFAAEHVSHSVVEVVVVAIEDVEPTDSGLCKLDGHRRAE